MVKADDINFNSQPQFTALRKVLGWKPNIIVAVPIRLQSAPVQPERKKDT